MRAFFEIIEVSTEGTNDRGHCSENSNELMDTAMTIARLHENSKMVK